MKVKFKRVVVFATTLNITYIFQNEWDIFFIEQFMIYIASFYWNWVKFIKTVTYIVEI